MNFWQKTVKASTDLLIINLPDRLAGGPPMVQPPQGKMNKSTLWL